MASPSTKKRLEKVTGAQYSLLRDLTDEIRLDTATLEISLADIPYPGQDDQSVYDAATIEAMIKKSLGTAEKLVRAFEKTSEGKPVRR